MDFFHFKFQKNIDQVNLLLAMRVYDNILSINIIKFFDVYVDHIYII